MTLTAIQVTKASEPGRYGDGQGLYLQVTKRGGKSWLLRYERGGTERWMGLGPLHTIGLKEARDKARRARQLLLDGVDPLEDRRAKRAAQAAAVARSVTFEAAARQYFDAHEKKWRSAKHRAQFLSTLATYAFPILGALPVSDVDLPLVIQVLEPIWKVKTETASRVRGRIETVLDLRPCAVSAQARIPRGGAPVLSTFSRHAAAWRDRIITRLCPTRRWEPSSEICKGGKV